MAGPEPTDSMSNFVAAYMLGAVTPDEAESIQAHLASCAGCREAERRFGRVVGELPLACPEAIPPARLRARILLAAGSDASVTGQIPAGWSDELLPIRSHHCYRYSNDDWFRRSLRFLRVGLEAPGELCLLIADIADHASLLGMLQEGYPRRLEDRIEEGKLMVRAQAPTRDEMVRGFAARLQQGVDAGFTTIRWLGYYPPAGRPGWPPADALVTMEIDIDHLTARYPVVCVCVYGPDVDTHVLRGINLHSHICMNGRTKVNPVYSGACGYGRSGKSAAENNGR